MIADNASVMARNAAAMILFDSDQFSGGVNVIDTDIDIKDISYNGSSINDVTNSSNAAVPNIYYIHKLNEQFAIGILGEAPQPVVVSDRLRNVPENGKWAWDPGAHFGIHRMDEFWFAEEGSNS